jgi:hypothetical protein
MNPLNSSPTKRPRNSEMYNKIINLKSKLANYNNNSVLMSQRDIQERGTLGNDKNFENAGSKLMSRTFIDNSQDNSPRVTEEGGHSGQSGQNGQRPMMSKINELKKKWNDVSSRTRGEGNITPDKNRINNKK